MALQATLQPVNVNRLTTGQIVQSDDIQRLASTMNWIRAEGGCGSQVSQAWDDQIIAYTGAAVTVCNWFVPVWSGLHTSLRVHFNASGPAGNGTVTFTTTSGGGTVNTGTTGAAADFTINIAVADGGSGYDILTMKMASVGSDSIVNDVSAELTALSSPIASGRADGYTPQGQTVNGDDKPLTQAHGDEWITDNFAHFETIKRVILNWSGADNIGGDANPYMSDGRDYMSWMRIHPGTEDAGAQGRAIFTCDADGSVDQVVRIVAGTDDLGYEVLSETTITAGSGTVTKDVSFDLPEIAGLQAFPIPFLRIGVMKPVAIFEDAGQIKTDANVASLVILAS